MKTKKIGFKPPIWNDALGQEFTVGDKVIYEDYGNLYTGIVSGCGGASVQISSDQHQWSRSIGPRFIDKKIILKEKRS